MTNGSVVTVGSNTALSGLEAIGNFCRIYDFSKF